jgi:hypothetical protein
VATCVLAALHLLGNPARLPEVLLVYTAGGFAAVVLLRCSRIVAGDREKTGFQLITISDMSAQEVVFIRLGNAVRRGLPWLTSLVAVLVYIAWTGRGVRWCGDFLCSYAVGLVSYAAIVLYVSLRVSTAAALGVAAALSGLWVAVVAAALATPVGAGMPLFLFEVVHLFTAALFLGLLAGQIEKLGRRM